MVEETIEVEEEKQTDKITGYCVRCKKKVEMKDIKISETKRGVEMRKGKCPDCGTTVCRIGKLK